MKVKLLYSTPLWVSSKAIRKCWASEDKSDTTDTTNNTLLRADRDESNYCIGEKDLALIERVGNKNKHSSTLEHLYYNFDIDGVSRALLQELARHRITSLSVKSTRYTLKELKDEQNLEKLYNEAQSSEDLYETEFWKICSVYVVSTENESVDWSSCATLVRLQILLQSGISNDIAKYSLPESYKTSLAWSINARSLQNFLSLRSDKAALWEIRSLAWEIYDNLPEDHQYLFSHFMKEYK